MASVRIPRTRGDGPGKGARSRSDAGDSPHARGWTPCPPTARPCPTGFPARAGMDRPLGTPRGPPAWIPRTRGDGPGATVDRATVWPDSPHARGWTRHRRRGRGRGRGFPARAGMDPPPAARRTAATWIPRTRGDGPAEIYGETVAEVDSPHARGWTRIAGPGAGFPARAGMDPVSTAPGDSPSRIPRTRGDGPLVELRGRVETSDSPHARGWTRAAPPGVRAGNGFPARAGMDPLPGGPREGLGGIPRTRGDGPADGSNAKFSPEDSPHARGWTGPRRHGGGGRRWTLGGGRRVHHDHGFPARAGMDPACTRTGIAPARIPRTRGDGPRPARPTTSIVRDSPHARGWTDRRDGVGARTVGFPARAGMDPRRDRPRRGAAGIPRTRGDGPRRADVDGSRPADSRTRGARPAGRAGFPARAGMDPVELRGAADHGRIPRTRGDGPRRPDWRRWRRGDSPHARGWTLEALLDRHDDLGFPARAGMDPCGSVAAQWALRIPRTRGDGPCAGMPMLL